MAKFISISGPSFTGKTSLINSLSTYPEMSKVVFSPDLYEAVWTDLVEKGFFTEWSEINTDSEYLCVYILRLIDYYEDYIKSYENSNSLVILDGCWIDLSIYALINLWYNRVLKELQENILSKLTVFDSHLSRIYFTSPDPSKDIKMKYKTPYRLANIKVNRPLEIQYYNLFKNFKGAVELTSFDVNESSLFILDDLKKLGYL